MSITSFLGFGDPNATGVGGGWSSSNPAQQNFLGEIGGWWNKRNAPQMGANPYQGGWDSLISQLQQQASGQGPSLAGEAYKQANATGMNNVMSMARGGSAGAARSGQMQMGGMQQGLAQGYGNARLQEQMAAKMALQQALSGAGQAWFQPQAANMQATMGTQSNGQKLMQFLQQLAAGGATIAGAGKPAQAAPTPQYMPGGGAPGSYPY